MREANYSIVQRFDRNGYYEGGIFKPNLILQYTRTGIKFVHYDGISDSIVHCIRQLNVEFGNYNPAAA
jgi:hypothetical protein